MTMASAGSGPREAVRGAELTLRGVVLGAIITVLFTAANVYLGLKVGLTFATSIPAAVISMAVLRLFADASILENNIVQTIASAAGTLAAIVFVLPGLIMIGWWHGFPYWTTAAVCLIGGVLGVMFSVPLRRALVTGSDLPYPEGVAAAEVLRVGAQEDADGGRGLSVIILGTIASSGFALLAAMRLVAADAARSFRIGGGGSAVSVSWSMALIGVGHLVGVSVGAAMMIGLVIAWGILMPWLTTIHGLAGGEAAAVDAVFHLQIRFVGAGTIGVAALWTLLKILGPIVGGIRSALVAARARRHQTLDLIERDLPIGIVAGTIVAMVPPIAILLARFAAGGPIGGDVAAIAATIGYILVASVVVASVCGYMAGLIGASNSPVSGVGILAVLGISLLLVALFGHSVDRARTDALIAYALFTTAIVFSVATISNDNLQDLKTGQLVGATPWKQQVALILGVVFGSLVIPPILGLLDHAFGFQGAPGAGPHALAAPQAALISALARGILGGDLDWTMIGLGALIGVAAVTLDEVLARRGRTRLPPLGLGMGIYLPMGLTILIPVGAVLGAWFDRQAARRPDAAGSIRMGVLAATGLIVGESLFGVVFAGIVGATGSDAPLAVVGAGFATTASLAAPLVFAAAITLLYRRTLRATRD